MKPRGRVQLLPFMPALNRLVKNGLITPETLNEWVQRYLRAPHLTNTDVVMDLMGLEVPENKMDIMTDIISEVEKQQGGNMQHG